MQRKLRMWQMSSKCLTTVRERSRLSWDLLLAVVAVAAVTGLRLLLIPVLYDRAAFLLFSLAVMASSWIGGRRVGLITTALATVVGLLLFVRMFPESYTRALQNEMLVALFAVEGCGISFLAGLLHDQRSKARQEARNATQVRNEISDLIDSIPDGFQAYDADFRLTFMNRATGRVLDRNAEQLLGATIWDQFPALDAEVGQVLRLVMLEQEAPPGAKNTYPLEDCACRTPASSPIKKNICFARCISISPSCRQRIRGRPGFFCPPRRLHQRN
jgi:PAS domain-containing protein